MKMSMCSKEAGSRFMVTGEESMRMTPMQSSFQVRKFDLAVHNRVNVLESRPSILMSKGSGYRLEFSRPVKNT
jgi:hypothetical protein